MGNPWRAVLEKIRCPCQCVCKGRDVCLKLDEMKLEIVNELKAGKHMVCETIEKSSRDSTTLQKVSIFIAGVGASEVVRGYILRSKGVCPTAGVTTSVCNCGSGPL